MNSDGNLPMIQPLTDREMEILRLISRGLSNREIASDLVLTSGTVKWYNRQIYRKLGVHSRTQPADKIEIDRYQDDVRAQLDERTFEKARAEGRAMSLEDAVALALDENAA